MASHRSPPNDSFPILPDWGLELVPIVNALWLTDAFVLSSAGAVLIYLLVFDIRPLAHSLRIGHVISAAYFLRSLSMLVTSLPDPRPGCVRVSKNFFTTFALHRCGDCIFSGHMSLLTIFLLYAWSTQCQQDSSKPGKKRRLSLLLFRSVVSACLVGGTWAILANRTHYTVDLVVAVYTCATLWYAHAHFSSQLEVRSSLYYVAISGQYRPFIDI